MFNVTKLLYLRAEAGAGALEHVARQLGDALARVPRLTHFNVRPVGDYTVSGGDLACHAQFATEGDFAAARQGVEWQAVESVLGDAAIAAINGVTYRNELVETREPGIRDCIHRTLLLAVKPGTPPAKIAQFEAEMREMPAHLPAIRNWSFSRAQTSTGARAWTHIWEQEFADVAGLNGPYMMHPIHFAHIDRWFDTESHDWIVDPLLCHSYWPIDRSVIAAARPA